MYANISWVPVDCFVPVVDEERCLWCMAHFAAHQLARGAFYLELADTLIVVGVCFDCGGYAKLAAVVPELVAYRQQRTDR